MTFKETVYSGVSEEFGTGGQLWEDYVRPATFGATDQAKALLRAVEILERDMVTRYFSGFDNSLTPGAGMSMGDNAYTSYIGTRGEALVDLMLVPTEIYRPGLMDPKLALPAVTKAYSLGLEKVDLIQMDRDKQEWACFTVVGDFQEAAKSFEALIDTGKPGRIPLTISPDVALTTKLDGYLWSLNSVPSHRKTKVIHPSEISTSECDRKIAYGLVGEEGRERVDPKLRRIFDVGHVIHDVVQRALHWGLPNFESEVRARHKDLQIDGSCDGVLTQGQTKIGLEIKSMGSSSFRKLTKAKPEHIQQATIYGATLELSSVTYLYVCKEDADIASFDLPLDTKVWHQLAMRAEKILGFVKKGDLPPQIENKSVCSQCKYNWTCKPELNPANVRRSFSR